MRRRCQRRARLALAALWLTAGSAHAGSGLELTYPATFETIPASTFGTDRERIGGAHLLIEELEDGNVRIFSESGVDGGARTIATAVMTPIHGGRKLRLLTQESRSFDPEGRAIGVLSIDHRSGEASCAHPSGQDGAITTQKLALPENDRVANVPLNLLFDPLVRDEVSTVGFQILLCRGGPRLMDFKARVVRREDGSNGHSPLVEVRYGPDLGPIISLFAQSMIPQLSFWFDPQAKIPWLAHRMPLYSDGPEVFVIRDGVSARWLSN